ncbi:type IV toxin-antitoxin system AbiEi family antitoxin domain-containing protein [Thiothrix lacustris]|jgi:hypothetical protein|uniref:type IV toxin-antitoxin system AbiEi family antitoxin domain-containing protein n=1 Tax=Thiothrix lacustris TaxID=525917 RepID=UPI0006843911|nr:hypothetical protein [Thiothrix lacustris]WMP17246.1 hypothetical protein RCS87_17955 [Thiothrix lacustris]
MRSPELQLKSFGNIPLMHQTVLSVLKGYKTPNNKISRWLDDGVLLPVKRGMYVVSPELSGKPVERLLVANLLYGPSCVSLDYALWHHGLIPEKVVQVTSVTTRRSQTLETGVGRFSYQHLPDALYPIGMESVAVAGGGYCLLATPAKALCDRLILTRQLRVHSVKSMQQFLLDDMRLDADEANLIDLGVIAAYQQSGHKTELLTHLHEAIKQWQ